MKTIVLTLASVFAIIATPLYAQDKLNPGDDLPIMKTVLQNANGSNTTITDAFGQNGLVVMFSCNTCPFVIRNQPITKKVMEYAAAYNVGMVIINSNEGKRNGDDSYEEMKKYAKDQGYTVPYLVDENSVLADMFGASHTPEIFLFNKQHKLVYKGAMNDNPSNPDSYKKMYIEDAINAMIAGKEADPKTTKSIGCGIKHKS